MGANSSQPRMTIKAKGRGPIPPAFINLQNELQYAGMQPTTMVSTAAMPAPIMASYPVAAPLAVAPPVMATATTTDTVISGPMLPPRLPPVPIIDHPIQPGIYGTSQVGPSTVETVTITQPPFVAGALPPLMEETTIINATAPPQPSPMMLAYDSPQPSPPATYLQQNTYQRENLAPPMPAGYADQTEFYQGNGAYASDNEDDDDTGSYTSFEEEVFVGPPQPQRGLVAPPVYSRRSSPNFAHSIIRDSPPPAYIRESPPPAFLRDSPPPLSSRSRSAYTFADTPYERYAVDRTAAETPYDRYSRSRAFNRYQERVNSRMNSYDQIPDRYGFFPNAYRM